MTGYVRVDTANNIADGNIIAADDLDNEFDGVQLAFNSSTGHSHDGSTGEGAPILAMGPSQDVLVGASSVTPKTTNVVNLGSSFLKFKDLYLAGNASVGGTLAVTGVATLGGGAILNTPASITLTNATGLPISTGISGLGTGVATFLAAPSSANLASAVTDETGTGALVFANSPTLVTPALGTPASGVVTNLTGTASININGTVGVTTPTTGAFTTLAASGNVTLSGGTVNGVPYLNGSKVLTSGSALTFDGTNFGIGTSSPAYLLDVNGIARFGSLLLSNDLPITEGGTGASTASGARTNFGATTLGGNLFTITNVAAISFPRFNADNTVSSLDAASFRTAIGAGTGSGTVTGVTATAPVASSGGTTPVISLDAGYGDTLNPYASKTANTFLAAPSGSSGVPTFRAIIAADIPTLNQNTTGTASNVTGTVAIANGGTGQTTRQEAMDALAGAVTAGSYLRGNGTDVVMSTIQAADVPTLNQNTTGSASSLATTNWTVTESSTKLVFSYGGVAKFSIDSSGNMIVTGNVTAYGTP